MWLLFEIGILMSWILLPHRRAAAPEKDSDDEPGDQATN
jgi:Sec-independent protein secretion pathway component TatC